MGQLTVVKSEPLTVTKSEPLTGTKSEAAPTTAELRKSLGLPPLVSRPAADPRETRLGAAAPTTAAMLASAALRAPLGRLRLLTIPVAGAAGAYGQGLRSLMRVANDPIPEGPGLAAVKRLGAETLGIPGEMLKEGLRQAMYQAGGEGLGATLRGAGNLLRGGSLRAPGAPTPGSPPPPTTPAAPPPNPNAGGRLVPGRAQADVLAEALAEARQPPRPTSVELPPGLPQPPVSYPRVPTTSPVARPTRIVRPGTPAPTTTVPPAAPVVPAAPPPAAAQTTAAAAGEVRLPESWKPFVQPPAATPTPAQSLTPRVSASPVGVSDAPPLWGGTGQPGANADELRRLLGADEAGAILGQSDEAVRAATGGPSRIPMVAELAEMDRDYLRRIMDPKGEVPAKALNWLASVGGLGSLGGMVGGGPGAAVGGLVGTIAANPKLSGEGIHLAGRAPYANLFRTALLSRLALEDQ